MAATHTQRATGESRPDGTIDARTFAGILWFRRWLILGSVAVCTAGMVLAAWLMTPAYRVSTVLVQADVQRASAGVGSALGQLGGLADLAGLGLDTTSTTEETLAVLRSREFTEGFIRDNQLLPLLFSGDWDEAKQSWKGDKSDWPTLAEGFRAFDEDVRVVSQDRRTALVTMQIEWKDPVIAANWANSLVERINEEMRRRALKESEAAVSFLQKELEQTNIVETQKAIGRLLEQQINKRMIANVTHEYAFRTVDRALPPDVDDVVRPRKLVMTAMGFALGMLIGILAAVLLNRPTR